jgi:hypothetical protein
VQDACILAAAWWEHCDFQPGAAGPTRDAAHGRSDRERKCCTRLLNQFTKLLKLSPSFGHSAFHIITSYALVNAPPRFSSFASMYLSLSKMVPPHRTATSHPRAVSMLGVQGAASADGVLRCCGVIERAWKSVPRWSVAGRQQAYAAGATRVDAASATKGPRTRNVMPD